MANRIIEGNFPLNINFNLRTTTPRNKRTTVNAVVRFGGQRIVLSGITRTEPRFWDTKKGAPRQHAANAGAAQVQSELNKARHIIQTEFTAYTQQYNAFPHNVKAFQELLKRKVFDLPEENPEIEHNVISYTRKIIQEIRTGKRTNNGKPYSPISYKGYGTLCTQLNNYAQARKLDSIGFNDVDIEFYDDFRQYLITECSYSPNYFGSLIKCLKTVMADALEYKLHSNTKFKSRKFIKEQTPADTIYLDTEKLDALAALDVSGYLNKARDLFLIGAYTGLRFSDFTSIGPDNIQGDFIRIKTQKTGERVAIPISDNLKAIMDKYDGGVPEPISNQKLNTYLKELGKLAGFTEEVSVKKYVNGIEVYRKEPLYKLITTHTARRSFASNCFRMGIPSLLIMAITGHKTEAAFLKYIRQSNEDKAVMFMELLKRNNLKVVSGGAE